MPTFGKTEKGATEAKSYKGFKMACLYELTEDGIVTGISIYFGNTGFDAKAAIYEYPTGKLLVESPSRPVNSMGWNRFPVMPTSLKKGAYGLAWKQSEEALMYYDAGVANQTGRNAEEFDVPFSDPFGTPQLFATAESIYATYTTFGAGWAFPILTRIREMIGKFRGG